MTRKRGGSDTAPPSPFVPEEEWINQLNAQFTSSLRKNLVSFAANRMRIYGVAGDPRDVVSRAAMDTSSGHLPWKPQRKSLNRHLKDVIRRRVHAEFERTQHLPHHSIDETDDDGESPVLVEMEIALWQRQDQAGLAEQTSATAFAQQVLDDLRARAGRDAGVLRLLSAIEKWILLAVEKGILQKRDINKGDILRLTGMSAQEYRNACRRLLRLVKQRATDVAQLRDIDTTRGH